MRQPNDRLRRPDGMSDDKIDVRIKLDRATPDLRDCASRCSCVIAAVGPAPPDLARRPTDRTLEQPVGMLSCRELMADKGSRICGVQLPDRGDLGMSMFDARAELTLKSAHSRSRICAATPHYYTPLRVCRHENFRATIG